MICHGLAPNLQYRFIFGRISGRHCVLYFGVMSNLDQVIRAICSLNCPADLG